MCRKFFECNPNRVPIHLLRQVLRAVLMAVRPDPELKRGVAHIRALTFRTGVKSGHFFGACPPQNRLQRPARTALQLPPERGNPRKKQVPGITQ